MKERWLAVVVCFAVGVTLGWWFSGSASSDASGAASAPSGDRRANDMEKTPVARTKDDADLDISPQQLTELVELGRATALSMENMQHGNPTQLDTLAKWAGLEAAQKQELEAILREAAQARLEWESKEVKATRISSGHWLLEFPSDKGSARAALKQRIEAAFPPDAARAIQLAGDLDHFFGFGSWAPGFRHGQVEVITRRTDGADRPHADGDFLELKADTDHGSYEGGRRIDDIGADSESFRLMRLLGPADEILHEAAGASR